MYVSQTFFSVAKTDFFPLQVFLNMTTVLFKFKGHLSGATSSSVVRTGGPMCKGIVLVAVVGSILARAPPLHVIPSLSAFMLNFVLSNKVKSPKKKNL